METDPIGPALRLTDAYLRECASRTVLEVIANKWTCLLVDTLEGGPLRFGVLRRKLEGITQKSLTQNLRSLERSGMVVRTAYPTIPPRVEYELSALGHSVVALMRGIREWSESHVSEITAARQAYDTTPRDF